MVHTTTPIDIVLTSDERTMLERLARSGRTRADLARRARIVLRLADGASYLAIQRGLGESSRTIGKWKQRFLAQRVDGLQGRYPGAVATVLKGIRRAGRRGGGSEPPATPFTQVTGFVHAAAAAL